MKTYPIEYYRSGLFKKWRARIVADNGRIIFASSQGYWNRKDCEDNVTLIGICIADHVEQ